MQRRKPLGQLRTEESEGGDSASGGQVARPGIVADERTRAVHQPEQLANRARRSQVLLASRKPPMLLVRIAGDLDAIVLLAQPGDQAAITFQGPDPHRLA